MEGMVRMIFLRLVVNGRKKTSALLGSGMREQKTYLGQTDRTEPVSFWDSLHLGPKAVNMAATITSITK